MVMESFAKLIHKSNITYLPTKLPVQFYGLPDGKVYLIYARFYEIEFDRTYLEYVFAEHKEFSYDYTNEKLVPNDIAKRDEPVYNELVDKPEPKIKILMIQRNLNSFAEACTQLNSKAKQIFENLALKNERRIQEITNIDFKNLTATG
jgi:hypothetical protein